MALNSRPALDPRWTSRNRNVASSFMLCMVEIIDQKLSDRVYDPETNTWDSGFEAIWGGNARIQPISNPTVNNNPLNDAIMQQVQVQIDMTDGMTDIRPGHYLKVLSSPVNSQLDRFVYVIRSVVNSSNAWQRTLICDVNMEADPYV